MKRDLACLFSFILASTFATACSSGSTRDDVTGGCKDYPSERTQRFNLTTADATCSADAGADAGGANEDGGACTCEALCQKLAGATPKSCRFVSAMDLECTVPQICPGGRKPELLVAPLLPVTDRRTAFLLGSAHMEAASVVAFSQLAVELAALGAPDSLTERVHAAAEDERRHARAMLDLAGRHSLPEVVVPPSAPRDAFAIALDNARAGCVRETFAALVAQRQGVAAHDEAVRSAMAAIARDETRHATLSWDLAAWLDEQLAPAARAAIADARAAEASSLRAELARGGLPEDSRLGLPSAREAVALLDELVSGLSLAA